MPIITRPLNPNDTGQAVADLHQALVKYGAPIADAEKTGKRFGDSTLAAVLDFRKAHGLPPPARNAPPFDASVGRLLHAATAAVTDDRAALRTAVRESIDAGSTAPAQESYWLARYALVAGDFPSAKKAAARAPQLSVLVTDITAPSRDPRTQPPRPPEVPYPENFYTYLYNLVPQDRLDELLGRTAADSPGARARVMLRIKDGPQGEGDYPEDIDGEPDSEPPAGEPATSDQRKKELLESADAWLAAVDNWQLANKEFKARRYASAVSAYTACQQAVLTYFGKYYSDVDFTGLQRRLTLDQRIHRFVVTLAVQEVRWAQMWEAIRQRRFMLSLQELGSFDWGAVPGSAITLLEGNRVGQEDSTEPPPGMKTLRQRSLDRPLVILATVMVPLARAEANRLRRQYDAAERDLRRVLTPYTVQSGNPPPTTRDIWLTCDFIERPFARLLLAETLLDKADVQYKGRMPVAEPDRAALVTAAGEYRTRFGDGDPRNQDAPFQAQQAAKTYLGVVELFKDEGAYVSRMNQGTDTLVAQVKERLAAQDVSSHRFRALGKDITIPTLRPVGNVLPGTATGVGPHEPLLKFQLPEEQPARETNPRVYAILLQTQARLLQIWSWFNYLGYADDYVPPWRFQFLLDRARYFAEHAKNAQREYLNFLNNAENEEFKELSAAQNVEMEKANVNIEGARVDQARLEVGAAFQSALLASLSASNSQLRLERYVEHDKRMDKLESSSLFGSIVGGLFAVGLAGATGGAGAGFLAFGGWAFNSASAADETTKAGEQRALEKYNLGLDLAETRGAEQVAQSQLEVAKAGVTVATLQREAALLRHEFALQNLNFLRNRILTSELWYRLSGAIRSVADTYLRYGIEMAFLAEQAYEFDADKRLDVIRFDYDVSDLGDMLAGDFLLRDLDTLEQDLIVGQKIRQQQVKYVLSLAREYPEALQELRDNGQMTFSMRLEQLERRFPGLFNVRISSVEVLPIALMDATRFSLELTQLGSGFVRLKTQPGDTPPSEGPPPDWLVGFEAEWLVKPRMMGPETAIFSGLSRQDLSGNAAFFASNQRGAFEGLPGAGAWRIDMSMKENRVVPDSLVDVLITFTLSGYYDANLRDAIDQAPRKPMAITTWFSAQQSFPDANYQFNRIGRMEWNVTQDMLALQGSLDQVQNVAVLCSPSQKRPELGRLMCSYPVEFELDAAGNVTVLRTLPTGLSFTASGLSLNATIPAGTSVTFDFGDGTGLTDSNALPHTYARPGRYEVSVRISANGRLTEYRAVVVISRQHIVLPPCIAIPRLQTSVAGGQIKLKPILRPTPGELLSPSWRIDNIKPDTGSDPITFTLKPGRYVLRFAARRPLKAHFFSQQRFRPAPSLAMNGLHLASNRTFDVTTGNETTTNLNAFGQHVFGAGPSAIFSPTDRWTLELPLDDNPCLVSVSSADTKQHDLGELSDVFLALEYRVRDE